MNKNWFIYKDNGLQELKGGEAIKYITRRNKKACEAISEIDDMVNDYSYE